MLYIQLLLFIEFMFKIGSVSFITWRRIVIEAVQYNPFVIPFFLKKHVINMLSNNTVINIKK